MSFIDTPKDGTLVACDLCGGASALFDPDWRRVCDGPEGQAQHLCRTCRPHAVWCASHGRYHQREANHRLPCAGCGGLFTAKVALGLQHCPSCRPAAPAPPPRRTSPTLVQRFLSLVL